MPTRGHMRANPVLYGLDTILLAQNCPSFIDTSACFNGYAHATAPDMDWAYALGSRQRFTSHSVHDMLKFLECVNNLLPTAAHLHTSALCLEEAHRVTNVYLGKVGRSYPQYLETMRHQLTLLTSRLQQRVAAFDEQFVYEHWPDEKFDTWMRAALAKEGKVSKPSHNDLHLLLLTLYQIAKPEGSTSSALITSDQGHPDAAHMLFRRMDDAPNLTKDFKRLLRNRLAKKKREFRVFLRRYQMPFEQVYP